MWTKATSVKCLNRQAMENEIKVRLSCERDGVRIPVNRMAYVGTGETLRLEIPKQDFLKDTASRRWVAFLVLFDPSQPDETFFERTTFFDIPLQSSARSVKIECESPNLALFFSPIKHNYVDRVLRDGAGTLRALAEVTKGRDVLGSLAAILGRVTSAEPLDFSNNLGNSILGELGLDFSGKSPKEIAESIFELKNSGILTDLPRFLGEKLDDLLFRSLSGLAVGVLPQLMIATKVLNVLRGFDKPPEIQFYDMTTIDGFDGSTTLRVLADDTPKLQLDENTLGEDGRDLRHVLCYHYQSIATRPTKLGWVAGDPPSLTLIDESEPSVAQTLQIEGDTFTFAPSVAMATVPFSQDWEVTVNFQASDILQARIINDCQLQISGFDRLFQDAHAPSLQIFGHLGFDKVLSNTFTVRR